MHRKAVTFVKATLGSVDSKSLKSKPEGVEWGHICYKGFYLTKTEML